MYVWKETIGIKVGEHWSNTIIHRILLYETQKCTESHETDDWSRN